jgi:hypothetical protein
MRLTKEQMQSELIKLRQSQAEYASEDETRRKALSKMLDADFVPKNSFSYSTERQRETLSWPEFISRLESSQQLGHFSTLMATFQNWNVQLAI